MGKLHVDVLSADTIQYKGRQYKETAEDAQVGDILLDEEHRWAFTAGEYYEIKRIDSADDPHIEDDEGEDLDMHGVKYTVFRKLGIVEEEKSRDPRSAFAVGDRVRLIWGGGEVPLRGFATGNVYTVNNPFTAYHSGERIAIAKANNLIEGQGGFALPSQLVKLTDEEFEEFQIKEAAKWSAIGRKVNEFKVGDVVESLGIDHGHRKGMIGTVTTLNGTTCPEVSALVSDGYKVLCTHVKLIAPVESVVNLLYDCNVSA